MHARILERLQDVLQEAGIPHINQSAYRKWVGCADAIFATQEVITRYLTISSKVLHVSLWSAEGL